MALSQQQLDDVQERLIGLTHVEDVNVRLARLAQLVLLLIETINDASRVNAVMDEIEQRHNIVLSASDGLIP